MQKFPDDEVGLLAGSTILAARPDIYNMHTRKLPSRSGSCNDQTGARELEQVRALFGEAAQKAVAKRAPAYVTPVFRCLGDFEKCKAARTTNKYVCRALFAICVGKHLIPLVPKGHDGQ
jgi:hypothetical protein